MEPLSEIRLKLVHPVLAAKVRQLSDLHAKEFPTNTLRVVQGLRSWDEQAAIYAQGRTAPGHIVTNAPPGHTQHNYGLAVDLVPMVNGEPDWDHTHGNWGRMIYLGKSIGLLSGSCWQAISDYPHFQLPAPLPVSPTEAMRSAYAAGGLYSVWGMLNIAEPQPV